MRRNRKTRMKVSWEIRYEEQAGKLRVLVDDLQRIREIKEKLDGGLRRLFAEQSIRALLCDELLDNVPAILFARAPARESRRDAPEDVEFYGVAPGAARLLHPRSIGTKSLKQLARMSPQRQIQVARLMIASGDTSEPCVNALVFATEPALLTLRRSRPRLPVDPAKRKLASKEISALSDRLQELMTMTNWDLVAVLVGCRYATKVLLNKRIAAHLKDRQPAVYDDLSGAVQRYWDCEFIQFGRS